ncbi:SH3 beta-barrel fold-containing protein [bacterium]|jgi:hypothetical protein|nr:SH3 beta-barrel fold-containing protein [bacterium]
MSSDTFKTQALELLPTQNVEVTFTKKDGSSRIMICTLQESALPPAKKEDPLTQKKVRAINEDAQVVWDVDKSAWRSFRWDSVTNVTPVLV